jgi:hypothetical protein
MSLPPDHSLAKPRPPAPQPLGQLGWTGLGCEAIRFEDAQARHGTLQQSEPGEMWLGRDGALMHLSTEQVAALVTRLQAWLANGSFNVPLPALAHAAPSDAERPRL